jgi:hypothetical protein
MSKHPAPFDARPPEVRRAQRGRQNVLPRDGLAVARVAVGHRDLTCLRPKNGTKMG